jgi:sugar-specific transcriptional regulator TrmB
MLPARLIAQNAGISRELTYVILGQLESLKLVEKVIRSKKVTLFRALHPKEMRKIVDEKKFVAGEASRAYDSAFQHLLTTYYATRHRPHVTFHEGIDGLKTAYQEILNETKIVYIFRSKYDQSDPQTKEVVSAQIKKQAEHGIRSYVLSPKLPHMKDVPHKHNLDRNITRKIIPEGKFSLPAQVIITEQKVYITSFQDEIMTTITESAAIAETFKTLFQYIWDSVE